MREIIESITYLWAASIMRVNLLILETKRFREKSTGMVFSINCDSILYIIYSKRMKIWRLNKKSFVFLLFVFTCILKKLNFLKGNLSDVYYIIIKLLQLVFVNCPIIFKNLLPRSFLIDLINQTRYTNPQKEERRKKLRTRYFGTRLHRIYPTWKEQRWNESNSTMASTCFAHRNPFFSRPLCNVSRRCPTKTSKCSV